MARIPAGGGIIIHTNPPAMSNPVDGPFRPSILMDPTTWASWASRDTFSWWSDGTSNQVIAGEKHIPLAHLGEFTNNGGDNS